MADGCTERRRGAMVLPGALAALVLAATAAPAAQYGTVTTLATARALSNGSVHITVNDTLGPPGGPGVCARRLVASANKDVNENILKVALAALLANYQVKVQYESSSCEIAWLEIRAQ